MRAAGEWEKCFQIGAVKAGMRAGRLCGRRCFGAGKMIVEMGGAFFEKNAAAMEQRLKECALDIHKQIDFYRKDYVEKMKVICPVGILGGIMISIMLI